MIVSGVRDTHMQFGAQLKSDLTGPNNFLSYALAIFIVGALGYIDKLRGVSSAFMALIIISMLLSNRGVFQKFQEALAQGPETPTPSATASATTSDKVLGAGKLGLNLLNPFPALGKIAGKGIWDYFGGK